MLGAVVGPVTVRGLGWNNHSYRYHIGWCAVWDVCESTRIYGGSQHIKIPCKRTHEYKHVNVVCFVSNGRVVGGGEGGAMGTQQRLRTPRFYFFRNVRSLKHYSLSFLGPKSVPDWFTALKPVYRTCMSTFE